MNIKKAQLVFERLIAQYNLQKPLFQEKIMQWREKGYEDLMKKGERLLISAEGYIEDIKNHLNKNENLRDNNALHSSIKGLKRTVREIKESMKSEIRQWIEAILITGIVVFVVRNFFFGLYHVPTGSAETNFLVGDRVCGNKLIYRIGYKPQRGDLVMFDDPNFQYDQSNLINYFWEKCVGFGVPLLGLNDGPQNVVKRVIAVPGETIEGRVEDGKTVIYLNNKKLVEPYVNTYPLIGLEKKTGFIDLDRLGIFPIPSFIQKQSRPVFYTYDPKKEFSEQPFYNMSSEEVLLEPGTSQPWLKLPFTPTKNQFGRVVDAFGPFTLPEGKYWVMGDSRKNSADSRFWGMLDEKLIHGRASFILYSVDSEEPFWLFEFIKNPLTFWFKSIRWNRFFSILSSQKATTEEEPKKEDVVIAVAPPKTS